MPQHVFRAGSAPVSSTPLTPACPEQGTSTEGSYIRVEGPSQGVIPETMVCRIILFMLSSGPPMVEIREPDRGRLTQRLHGALGIRRLFLNEAVMHVTFLISASLGKLLYQTTILYHTTLCNIIRSCTILHCTLRCSFWAPLNLGQLQEASYLGGSLT